MLYIVLHGCEVVGVMTSAVDAAHPGPDLYMSAQLLQCYTDARTASAATLLHATIEHSRDVMPRDTMRTTHLRTQLYRTLSWVWVWSYTSV